MVFIECMACGTPTIGANSGGPTEFVKPGQGVLVEEEADWRTEPGMKRRSWGGGKNWVMRILWQCYAMLMLNDVDSCWILMLNDVE